MDAIYSQGESACDEGRFEAAADLIRAAIRLNGRNPAFHYKLGVALQSAGKLASRGQLLGGNRAGRRPSKALNNLGSLLHARGQLRAALENSTAAPCGHSPACCRPCGTSPSPGWSTAMRGRQSILPSEHSSSHRTMTACFYIWRMRSRSLVGTTTPWRHAGARSNSRPASAGARRQLGNVLRESGDLFGRPGPTTQSNRAGSEFIGGLERSGFSLRTSRRNP